MTVEYAPGYPINTNPAPNGDTVKAAVEKHIQEFLKAYAALSSMYQQIITELKYADVDSVDGKHADNTANNLPVLNSLGQLTNDIVNDSIETEELTVSGAAKVGTLQIGDEDVGNMVTARIKVVTGQITHGGVIPLPPGFTEEQCVWFVIPRYVVSRSIDETIVTTCYADSNRIVTIISENRSDECIAQYVIIGIK